MNSETIGTIVSAPVIAFIIDLIMRFTPKAFDRRRFALPLATFIAIMVSILESLAKSHINIWDACVRGVLVGMASAGAYDIYNNYSKDAKAVDDNE